MHCIAKKQKKKILMLISNQNVSKAVLVSSNEGLLWENLPIRANWKGDAKFVMSSSYKNIAGSPQWDTGAFSGILVVLVFPTTSAKDFITSVVGACSDSGSIVQK